MRRVVRPFQRPSRVAARRYALAKAARDEPAESGLENRRFAGSIPRLESLG
jgi:hypothetical protein